MLHHETKQQKSPPHIKVDKAEAKDQTQEEASPEDDAQKSIIQKEKTIKK